MLQRFRVLKKNKKIDEKRHHMADKLTTSRVGRPRSRPVIQTPKGAAKVGRPQSKSAQKTQS